MNKADKKAKIAKVMKEFKGGSLHSGKKGPVVKGKKQAIAILSGNPVMESKSLELSNGASDIDDIGELYAGTANTQNPRPNTGKSRGIDYNRKVASSTRRVVMNKEMTAEKWDKMTDKQKARFCRKQVSNIRRKK